MPKPAAPLPPPVTKLVLAVHGIGDQTRNSTILATATHFCRHFGHRALIPLGGFHDTLQPGRPPLVLDRASTPPGLAAIGFAEVYWADLARSIETAGFTLQETKEWCRSVVSRMRVLAERREPGRSDIHYGQIEHVLEEAIDALRVLESLLFLARKAGVLDFDLRRLLDDYLGDVQLVSEFAPVRAAIVGRLHATLDRAHAMYPDAEIHLVAHSEGTVVSFLGLLEAAGDPVAHPWITRVRGYMTLGSPIDKHLILWPELFAGFHGPHASLAQGPGFKWLNYVDNGDPVGFELDTARWWLGAQGYDRLFRFSPADDYYFTRYYVPGKAHTDYWDDADVFQHFISHVVAPPSSPAEPPPPARREELRHGPRQRNLARFTSYVVAYLIPAAALVAAVYFLTKGIEQYLDPLGDREHPDLLRNVLATGLLLGGLTAWLRLSQLVGSWRWHLAGACVFGVSAGAFSLLATPTEELDWLNLPAAVSEELADPRLGLVAGGLVLVILVRLANARWLRRILTPVFPDWLSTSPSTAHPPLFRNTIKVVLALAAVALLVNAVAYDALYHPERSAFWPLVLAAAAFLYLWRLAALVFDLVFIWHRYIRHSGALDFLRRTILPASALQTPPAPPGRGEDPQ